MIIRVSEDRIAEIVLEESEYAPDAMDVARELLRRGIVVTKTIRIPGFSGPGIQAAGKRKE
jgi:hypothetical protein